MSMGKERDKLEAAIDPNWLFSIGFELLSDGRRGVLKIRTRHGPGVTVQIDPFACFFRVWIIQNESEVLLTTRDFKQRVELLELLRALGWKREGGMDPIAHPYVILTMYVVYHRPSDSPEEYVVRRHHVMTGGLQAVDKTLWARGLTLEFVRNQIPPGYANVGRAEFDDPAIAEVWL